MTPDATPEPRPHPTPARPSPARRALGWVLKAVVSGGLLWLTFEIAGDSIDFSELSLTAPLWLGAAVMLMGGIVMLLTLRWRLIARRLDGAPEGTGFGVWAALIWSGIAVSQVVPGGISGDAVRIWGLRIRGVSVLRAIEGVALDRVAGLAGLIALGAIGWVALNGVASLLPAAGAGVAALVLGWLGWRWISRAEGRLGQIGARLAVWGTVAFSRSGAAALCLAAAGHALNVVIFVLVARAFGLDLPLAAAFLAVPAGLFAAALPVSLGGWGVRELAVAKGFELLGGDPGVAVQASILFGVFHLCANAPALLLLAGLRWGRRSWS